MSIFSFHVDEGHARARNELLKDTKRLQLSAVIFGAILIALGWALQVYLGGMMGTLVLTSFALMAIVSFIIALILPGKVGSAQQLYDNYHLCPAIIAKVNPRDMVLLALVNLNTDLTAAPRWGLAARTVTRIEGHARTTGEKVPSVAITGRRSMKQTNAWDEITPMPIAWGTTDQGVITEAKKAIPHEQWQLLMKNANRLKEVLATRFNLLPLE